MGMKKNSEWQQKLGQKYKELDDSFWFSPNQLTCGDDCLPDCNDKKNKFEFGTGFRVPKFKEDQIGSGGFGTIFKAQFHTKKVAAKFIEVSESYREISKYEDVSACAEDAVAKLFETAHEVQVYLSGQLSHPNIIKLLEFWIQCSERNKIELVLTTPLCYCNLTEWFSKEPFDFDKIRTFLIQICSALEHVADQKMIHRDVKTDNILITNRRSPVALLADFGLSKADVNGLTPGFCSPEQLKKNSLVPRKTDIHGLGVVTIISLFKGESQKLKSDVGLALMFTPISSIPTENSTIINQLRQNKIVQLITKMVQYDPEKRPDFDFIQTELTALDAGSTSIQLPFKSDIENLGQTMAQLSIVDKTMIFPTNVGSKLVSVAIRDQLDSGFCWAFSTAKLVTAELRKFIKMLKMKSIIKAKAADEALRMADVVNDGNRLVYEIVCLLAPRNLKMEGITMDQAIAQTGNTEKLLQKLCSESILRPEGWKILPSLRTITDKAITGSKIQSIDEIELVYQTHHHPLSESVEKILVKLGPIVGPKKGLKGFTYNNRPFQVFFNVTNNYSTN